MFGTTEGYRSNPTRLRNFDEDSDVDEIDQEVRSAVRKSNSHRNVRNRPNKEEMSDDSHDENMSGLLPTNALNTQQEPSAKHAVRATNVRRVVSKPASNGTNSNSSSVDRGFVPRDLNSKIKRQPAPRRQGDEEHAQRSQEWTVPKKFLGEPAAEESTASRINRNGIPSVGANNKPSREPPGRRPPAVAPPPSKPSAFPAMSWQNQVQGEDSDEEGSAHTEEAGDEQRYDSGDDDVLQEAARGGRQASDPERRSRSENHSLEVLADEDIIQDGEFYEDYRARSLAAAGAVTAAGHSNALTTSRPNKSGRYTEEGADAAGASQSSSTALGGWMGASLTRGGVKSCWSSVQLPPGPSSADFGPNSRFSFVMVAHARGVRTEHVQCTVVRDRRASINGKLYPTYELILEETNKPIIVAQKMNLNRTSNYHLFDLTRANLSSKLSKKSGNYLGKLRAKNINRTEYVLLNQNSEREEIAGVRFDRVSLMNQIKEGNQPRKMKVMIPPINEFGLPIPNKTADSDEGSLAEKLAVYETTALGNGSKDLFVFESKDPVLENGNFRLNFHGRVSKPSVKNFQMVSREDTDNIICQFGKVDEDVFHLDFKAPINAVQAFAFALCQFNL